MYVNSLLLFALVAVCLICTVQCAINPNPYLRVKQVWFIEEPASAAFSFVGFIFHWKGFKRFQAASHGRRYPFVQEYSFYSYAWLFLTLASTAFHIHEDRPYFITEKLDYFGVFVALLVCVYSAIMRSFNIRDDRTKTIIGGVMSIYALWFMYHMTFVLFDYGYHLKTCAGMLGLHGMFYIGLWLRGVSHAKYMVLGHLLFAAASPLEIFDFAPIFGVFDGHSLWHFMGNFGALLFNEYMVRDAKNYGSPSKLGV